MVHNIKQDAERYRQAMERIRACRIQLAEITELRKMGTLALREFREDANRYLEELKITTRSKPNEESTE